MLTRFLNAVISLMWSKRNEGGHGTREARTMKITSLAARLRKVAAKSLGHAHHVYYLIACILAVLGRREVAFERLERSVSSGFACWPFFLKDACLQNLRDVPEFEVLVSSLQAKYPDHLGLL
jgi:hypothetical protein